MQQDNPASERAYLLDAGRVADALETDLRDGMTAEKAVSRQAAYGPNKLAEGKRTTALDLLLEQVRNPLLIILTVGAIISAYTGHWVDAIAILVIVVINAAIGFWQEWSAEQSMAALSEMSAPGATVRREGTWKDISATEVVPGDIVRLKAGDIVAADMRLAEAARLQIDEAALTGESEPVDKHADPLAPESEGDVLLADRRNMAFASTQVAGGSGIGIVTATGMATEVGHIANLMASAAEPKTPLQERIESLSRVLMGAALPWSQWSSASA